VQIFITRGEDSSGPYTPEQVQDYLAQGVLLPGDLAWHEGLEGWIPLSQLMASIAAPVDPVPPQPVAITPEPVQSGPTIESAPVKAGDKKKLLIGIGAGVAVLAIAVAVWFFVIREKDSGQQPQPKPTNIREKDSGKGNQQVAQQPKPTPKKETPKPEPKFDPTKHERFLWKFETGAEVWSSPAIGSDGTLYVGSSDKKVYALDGKSGVKNWEFETGDEVLSSPAIGSDGTVYVGSGDKKVYALNGKTGAKNWEFDTKDEVYCSPSIGVDGTIYIGSHGEYSTGSGKYTRTPKFYALDGKTGVKKWGIKMEGSSASSAIGPDGTIYVGSDGEYSHISEEYNKLPKFYALDGATGAKKWEFESPGGEWSPPAIGADGTVYVGAGDGLSGRFYALDGKTGTKKWGFSTGWQVSASPVIGADSTVYVVSNEGKVYALNGKTGVKKWESKKGVGSPAIGFDGTVYVGICALDGETGNKKWEFENGLGSTAIGIDGTIYIGSYDGNVYALKTESLGLAKSPWPMRGQNPQHTGRAIGVATTKPPEPAPPVNSKLADTLINKRVGISIEGDELWIQLNPDGTTLDYKGLTGTFKIENLTLSVQDDDGITMVEFVAPNPKEGDAVTVTGTREPGSPPILGPIKAKLVTLTKTNDSGTTDAIPPPPPIPNPSEPEPTKRGAGLWEFETGNYAYSSR